MGFKENILLKNFTTFKIGGPARYFCVAKNKKEIITAIKKAKELDFPFFILGEGSNLLVSDKGFNGLVIKNEARSFNIKKNQIVAESGAILSQIISASIEAGFSGLTEGIGIPGTIGGAVYGNAGWPRGKWQIGDLVKEIKILMPDGKIKKVAKSWMNFKYRNSRLKTTKVKKPIILEVVLKLKKGNKKELKRKLIRILQTRVQKIPQGFSAGCIFENPKGFSAGELIDNCGLKGKKIGGAQISKKHANFIINLGNAKAKDVVNLIKLAKEKVRNKFGIELEEEIQYLGF